MYIKHKNAYFEALTNKNLNEELYKNLLTCKTEQF